MRTTFSILFLFVYAGGLAQKEAVLQKQSILLHQQLISNDEKLANILDENLTYGHSSGWIETKTDVLADLKSGKLKYIEIKEDSMTESVENKMGYVRFIGNFTVVSDGKQSIIRIKVLEVWRKKNKSWKLYARQAVRA